MQGFSDGVTGSFQRSLMLPATIKCPGILSETYVHFNERENIESTLIGDDDCAVRVEVALAHAALRGVRDHRSSHSTSLYSYYPD